ncbi:MAG: protease HtpX [Dehalococcoidia bacterium]|nr:protease HtpX [Dehalococcoidia bacterium]
MTTNIRTAMLLAALSGLLMVVGYRLGGNGGAIVALVFAFIMNFFSYWFSDSMVLMSTGAHKVTEQQEPELYSIIRELANQVKMPMPKVYVVESDSPNAFATGRNPNHAAVAATRGIMRLMPRQELKAVFAHELSHVRNRDTLASAMAATLAGAIGFLVTIAQWSMIFGGMRGRDDKGSNPLGIIGLLVTIILAPLISALIQMAISRTREYGADESAAKTFKMPLELASALETLEAGVMQRPMKVNPAMSHLYIVNPLKGGDIGALFSTHPPIKERVARLRAMAQGKR